MTVRTCIAGTAVLLFVSMGLCAETPENVLKAIRDRSTVDEFLYHLFLDDDCGLSYGNARDVINGVIIRSRIEPVEAMNYSGNIYLYVSVVCIESPDTLVFNADVKYLASIEGLIWSILLDYGALGTGDSAYLRTVIKESVERAITDFIVAHDG